MTASGTEVVAKTQRSVTVLACFAWTPCPQRAGVSAGASALLVAPACLLPHAHPRLPILASPLRAHAHCKPWSA